MKNQAIGRAEGMAGSVLTVLDARSLSVTEDQKRRILAETDLAQLTTWVGKAATVSTVDELFEH